MRIKRGILIIAGITLTAVVGILDTRSPLLMR